MKNEKASDLYNGLCAKTAVFITQGAAKTLLQYEDYKLLATTLILVEFRRIKFDKESLARERWNFEAWYGFLKNVPQKRVFLWLSQPLKRAACIVFDAMYNHPLGTGRIMDENPLTRKFLSYLITRGLLWKNINESEVSK